MADPAPGPDPARVAALRERSPLGAGFPADQAAELARRDDVPLAIALGLVRQGFPPEVAGQLLRAGHRPVF
ncbi:MAG: hypothetical protein R3C15_00890 [Thermoleophilia bacterium]